jgi:tRNA-specific 2-thiouridylase
MQKNNPKTVVVGMSGGVDSSVSAYLLKKAGYNVVGLFMKNWEETNDCGCCTAEVDFNDVKRVCETLEIPYYSVNFSRQYVDRVFSHFIDGLKRGITPNPDILCNREIKFSPFIDFADKIGADYIAMGHYARLENGKLKKAADQTKDQSYFLCGLNQKQLSRVIFPVGGLLKTQVRQIAKEQNLVTHDKPDSTGICFIGERNYRNFLQQYISNKSGDIKTLDGKTVGKHDGLFNYTIGQGKGMGIGATNENSQKWFVIKKDIEKNILYVNNGDCPELYSASCTAHNFNWINPRGHASPFECTCKIRYRQSDQKCTVEILDTPTETGSLVRVNFEKPQRAVTAGQWVVLYDGDVCLGGGEIIG